MGDTCNSFNNKDTFFLKSERIHLNSHALRVTLFSTTTHQFPRCKGSHRCAGRDHGADDGEDVSTRLTTGGDNRLTETSTPTFLDLVKICGRNTARTQRKKKITSLCVVVCIQSGPRMLKSGVHPPQENSSGNHSCCPDNGPSFWLSQPCHRNSDKNSRKRLLACVAHTPKSLLHVF